MASQFLHFVESLPNPGKKTKTWVVEAKNGGQYLGDIAWRSGWRRYVFYPASDCLFDPDCLRGIADFSEQETTKHKEKI